MALDVALPVGCQTRHVAVLVSRPSTSRPGTVCPQTRRCPPARSFSDAVARPDDHRAQAINGRRKDSRALADEIQIASDRL